MQSESRVARNVSTFSGAKDAEFRSSCVWLGMVGTEREELGTQDFEANTELRHSAFLRAESAVGTFEVRKGMGRGEYTRDGFDKVPPGFQGGRQV